MTVTDTTAWCLYVQPQAHDRIECWRSYRVLCVCVYCHCCHHHHWSQGKFAFNAMKHVRWCGCALTENNIMAIVVVFCHIFDCIQFVRWYHCRFMPATIGNPPSLRPFPFRSSFAPHEYNISGYKTNEQCDVTLEYMNAGVHFERGYKWFMIFNTPI